MEDQTDRVREVFRKNPAMPLVNYLRETGIRRRDLLKIIRNLKEEGDGYVNLWYSTIYLRKARENYEVLKNYNAGGSYLDFYKWAGQQIGGIDETQYYIITKTYGGKRRYGKNRSKNFERTKNKLEEIINRAEELDVDLTICKENFLNEIS